MTGVKDEKKTFFIVGSHSLFAKYKNSEKDLTVFLVNGEKLCGKINFYDDYSIKLSLNDGSGSVTIPIHNIISYECEHFLVEGEEDGMIFFKITEENFKNLSDKVDTKKLENLVDKGYTRKKIVKKLISQGFLDDEIDLILDNATMIEKVSRGVPKSTNRENQQLFIYKKQQEYVHFYLEDGHEITGRLKWFMDHLYCVEDDERDYFITKRHILYYKRVDPPKPERTERGKIKVVKKDKGFGFIIYSKGDIFFHFSELEDNPEILEPGKEVAFATGEGKKGLIALNIKLIA